MIESTTSYDTQTQAQSASKRVLKMVKNERMGGSVPAWVDASSEKELVQNALGKADEGAKSFDKALAYHTPPTEAAQTAENEFGFSDLLDMINPLQHIPLVNTVYRELTGDTIRPIGKIVGGAVFGGPMGAISGLVNTVVENETGQDIASNAYNFFTGRENKSAPEQTFALAAKSAQNAAADLPGNLLAFADLGAREGMKIERTPTAEGRTAGTTMTTESIRQAVEQIQSLQAREPITQVTFDSPFSDKNKED